MGTECLQHVMSDDMISVKHDRKQSCYIKLLIWSRSLQYVIGNVSLPQHELILGDLTQADKIASGRGKAISSPSSNLYKTQCAIKKCIAVLCCCCRFETDTADSLSLDNALCSQHSSFRCTEKMLSQITVTDIKHM